MMSISLRDRSLGCRAFSIGLVCALVIASLVAPLSLSFAQVTSESEAHERETLKAPVLIPSITGIYQGLEELPESIRRSRIFARDMHLLKQRVTNGSEYNYES